MLLSLITIVSLLSYLASSQSDQNRTCACGQFAEGLCVRELNPSAKSKMAADASYVPVQPDDYCQWRAVEDTKGNHGICRTYQYLQCKEDPECPHKKSSAAQQRHLLLDDISSDRTANVINNWPWGCVDDLEPLDTSDSEYQKAKQRGGRTCACDGFLETDCITMDSPMPNGGKCQWHTVTDSLGTHGICRTQTWLDGHKLIRKKNKNNNNNDHEQHRQLLDGEEEEYELEADENINVEINWPWECPEWTRESNKRIQAVNIMDNGTKSDIVQQSENSIYYKLFGLIIFAAIIGIAVWYKFKQNNDKKINLSENGGVSYSTFERV